MWGKNEGHPLIPITGMTICDHKIFIRREHYKIKSKIIKHFILKIKSIKNKYNKKSPKGRKRPILVLFRVPTINKYVDVLLKSSRIIFKICFIGSFQKKY